MTLTHPRPQEAHPMPSSFAPDDYRLLNALSGEPAPFAHALELAGLKQPGEAVTARMRAVVYNAIRQFGTVREVAWGGGGLVLTGAGEAQLEVYLYRYGALSPTPAQESARRARRDERARAREEEKAGE